MAPPPSPAGPAVAHPAPSSLVPPSAPASSPTPHPAAAAAASSVPASAQRADPEYAALSELLSSDLGEMEPPAENGNPRRTPGTRRRVPLSPSARRPARDSTAMLAAGPQRKRPRRSPGRPEREEEELEQEQEEEEAAGEEPAPAARSGNGNGGGGGGGAPPKHTRLADLEDHVRGLERENLHLKQALLLGKAGSAAVLASRTSREGVKQLLGERTKVVTGMVEQLNATYLSLGDAARVWHKDCRIGVGVREWDARGRLEAISLWNLIRSVFATIAVDIVELRPHLPDGEMMLTKWRVQGEIASPQQLEKVCASEDCPPTMRVALMAIKSSDLTFTVTTYVVFQDLSIAEQHHCWDQVGVFKRLFGGEIPPAVVRILAVDEDEGEENTTSSNDNSRSSSSSNNNNNNNSDTGENNTNHAAENTTTNSSNNIDNGGGDSHTGGNGGGGGDDGDKPAQGGK